jgi:hypothetical protein
LYRQVKSDKRILLKMKKIFITRKEYRKDLLATKRLFRKEKVTKELRAR